VKNLTWQNPEQLFVAQELINKVKSKCCGIKDTYENFKKKNLIHKYKVSNEKDLDFSDGDALHRFFYRL
jgi:hypothetical protein